MDVVLDDGPLSVTLPGAVVIEKSGPGNGQIVTGGSLGGGELEKTTAGLAAMD